MAVALPTEHLDFMQTVIATSVDKIEALPSGSLLFRAQVGYDWQPEDFGGGVIQDIECPLPRERMKPLSDRAYEGRANAKGIPCLYVATHERTAIAESRPWVGALVSMAQLRTARELRVLNCTTEDQRSMIYGHEPEPEERKRAVWRDIDHAFAEPVLRTDDVADYAPTAGAGWKQPGKPQNRYSKVVPVESFEGRWNLRFGLCSKKARAQRSIRAYPPRFARWSTAP